jgi:hypothetical protein
MYISRNNQVAFININKWHEMGYMTQLRKKLKLVQYSPSTEDYDGDKLFFFIIFCIIATLYSHFYKIDNQIM